MTKTTTSLKIHRDASSGPKPAPRPLSLRRPDLALQWHPTKNQGLHLDAFPSNSGYRAWWRCDLHHEWQATIRSRYSKRTGCRRCSLARVDRNHRTFAERRLSVVSPEIAATWHPSRNAPLTADDVTFSSRRKVWWQCTQDPSHIWDTTVNNRQRSGCPYCVGHMAYQYMFKERHRQSLAESHPELSKEWHPVFNAPLTPVEVTAGSTRLIWWQCLRDPEHLYQRAIVYRVQRKRGCPICYRRDAKSKHMKDNKTSIIQE
jgi:hypothetical protein